MSEKIVTLFKSQLHGDYYTRKMILREQAIRYLELSSRRSLSYYDLLVFVCYFSDNARKYGLICEFIENGVC